MDVAIEIKGVREAMETLSRVARDSVAATKSALTRIGFLAQREARRNAPISPSRTQIIRQRTTRRAVTRKARATSRPAPGQLVNSIDKEVSPDQVAIFVAANSAAGKYAYRMHELKNQPGGWRNRGPGTIAKGERADEKFIERAILDNAGNILDIIKAEHRKAGWYELR